VFVLCLISLALEIEIYIYLLRKLHIAFYRSRIEFVEFNVIYILVLNTRLLHILSPHTYNPTSYFLMKFCYVCHLLCFYPLIFFF
jgi:hypothetical protein